MKLKTLVLLVSLFVVTSQIAIAQAPSCTSGTLANVIGTSCSIGNLTFDFHNDFHGFVGITEISTNVFTFTSFSPDQIGFTPVQTDTQAGFVLNTHFLDNTNGTGLFFSEHAANFSYEVQVNGAFQITAETSQVSGSITPVETVQISAFDEQCFTNGQCTQVAPTVNFVPGFGSFNQPSASATLGIPALASTGPNHGLPFTTAVNSFAFAGAEAILDSASFLYTVTPQIPPPAAAKLRYKNIDLPGTANTFATAINNRGQVAGSFLDFAGGVHGYIAQADGSNLQVVDFPGSLFTVIDGINDNGDSAGEYVDNDGVAHGFALQNGIFTTVDFPNAIFNAAEGINDQGTVVGIYQDAEFSVHGYLFQQGSFTSIDDPNAFVFNGPNNVPFTITELFSLNDRGSSAGFSLDGNNVGHSFIFSEGVFHPVTVPAGVAGTFLFGLNAINASVGQFVDVFGVNHGFLSNVAGLATVDVPNAVSTFPSQINAPGQIVGGYSDTDGAFHSFLAESDNSPDSGIGTSLPLAEGHAGALPQKAPAPPCPVRQPLLSDPARHMTPCAPR